MEQLKKEISDLINQIEEELDGASLAKLKGLLQAILEDAHS